MSTTSTRILPILLGVTLPCYLLDQATKLLTLRSFAHEEYRVIIPDFFTLGRWHNTGAAFSFMSGNNAFFIGLSLIAITVLCILLKRSKFPDLPSRIAASLLMAGILGNLTDRLAHGYVVDFLVFNLHLPYADPWPAFNVADSCIFIAAGLFIIQSFRQPAEETTQSTSTSPEKQNR